MAAKKALPHQIIVAMSVALACVMPLCSWGQAPGLSEDESVRKDYAPHAVPATVAPPPLPARPALPAPPADAVLPPPRPTIAKPPLSWRARPAKEYPTVVQTAQVQNLQDKTSNVSHTFPFSFDDTLLAVITSCPAAGFSVDQVDSSSGFLTITPEVPRGGSKSVKLRLYELSPGKTIVAADMTGLSEALRPAMASLIHAIERSLSKRPE